MCGPTDAQTQLQTEQMDFYKQLQDQDAITFKEDQGILTQMQATYAPILAKGPNQYGFSQGEQQNLTTEATEGVAANYAGAKKALGESQAAQGGGNTFLPSGVSAQQNENLDASAAQAQSAEQLQVKQAGYSQGYDEFNKASSALEGTASLLNPNGSASTANSAGSAAGTTAATIASENESWMAPLAGVVGAVGSAAVKAYAP